MYGGDFYSTISEILAAAGYCLVLAISAYATVDLLKSLPNGGLAFIGFAFIRKKLRVFSGAFDILGNETAWDFLSANWINGTALADQKAKAKMLVGLCLTTGTATPMGQAVGFGTESIAALATAVTRRESGIERTKGDEDVLTRFDQIVGLIVDAAYERADQKYRYAVNLAAMISAVIIAMISASFAGLPWTESILFGLIATPIAGLLRELFLNAVGIVTAAITKAVR